MFCRDLFQTYVGDEIVGVYFLLLARSIPFGLATAKLGEYLVAYRQLFASLCFLFRGKYMTFANLNLDPKILQAIETCGYTKPTPVQSKTIPYILDGKDVVASAQTGTGKTAAYVLPGIQMLLTKKSIGKPRILILAPTRELALQITKVIGKYGKFAKINIANFIGGMPYHRQLRELSRPIDIIIATPGRLMDHMDNKRLDLSHIEMLVVDEADRMLDMGFIDDITTIVQATPKSRQTLLFSATTDDKLMSAVKNLLKDPIKINISQDKVDINLIKQKMHIVSNPSHKTQLLELLIDRENIFKAIIFSATKSHASKLALQLRDIGYAASPMHGDLKQSVRNRTLAQFRTGEIQFLVATDVAARGIDVTDISHVINYDLPKFSEDYVHRIGRTGRAGKTGIAISIALRSEIFHIKKIERYIGNKIQQVQITEHGEQEVQHALEEPSTGGRGRQAKRKSSRSSARSKSGDSRNPYSDNSETRSYRSDKPDKSHKRRSSTNSEPRSFRSARSDAPQGDRRRSFGNDSNSFRSKQPGEARERRSSINSEPRSVRSARSDEPRSERRNSFGNKSNDFLAAKTDRSHKPRSRTTSEPRAFHTTSSNEARGERRNSFGGDSNNFRSAKPGEKRKRRGATNFTSRNLHSAKPEESRGRSEAKKTRTAKKNSPKK